MALDSCSLDDVVDRYAGFQDPIAFLQPKFERKVDLSGTLYYRTSNPGTTSFALISRQNHYALSGLHSLIHG